MRAIDKGKSGIRHRLVWMLWLLCVQRIGLTEANSNDFQVREINICQEESSFYCSDGELISIENVSCNADETSCPPFIQTAITEVCDGQQTCSNEGLHAMLKPVSCSDPIRIQYRCRKGLTSLCQTNICSAASNGLFCPKDFVIHIRQMTCISGSSVQDCPQNSYSTLYICEGERYCNASGLKSLLCQDSTEPLGNSGKAILAQYFCVPESQVDRSCATNRSSRLKGPFGVIRPPRPDIGNTDVTQFQDGDDEDDAQDDNASDASSGSKEITNESEKTQGKTKNKKSQARRCKWIINPVAKKIDVRIHQLTATHASQSSLSTSGATTSFSSSPLQCPPYYGLLMVKYKDCKTGNKSLVTLCTASAVFNGEVREHKQAPLDIISCGGVQLTSALPSKDGDQSAVDKLIVSYHKIPESAYKSDDSIPASLATCMAAPTSLTPPSDSSAPADWSSSLVYGVTAAAPGPAVISRNFGPQDGLLDTADDNDTTRAETSPFKNLKLMILYVVFGVVIFALLVALIVVIVSYNRISGGKKRGRADSTERTALWLYPRHEDTPLDTFQTNSMADGSASMTGSESSQRKVIASVHQEPDINMRTSKGSGISTFLGGPGEEQGSQRDSTGLKDLIATFQSGTFSGYTSLKDVVQPGRYSTGSLDTRNHRVVEYELTNTTPAVIGGNNYRHSCGVSVRDEPRQEVPKQDIKMFCDDGPLYASAGAGHYEGIASVRGSGIYAGGSAHYSGIPGDLENGHYQGINEASDGHYASPNSGDYAEPISGQYDVIGTGSGLYESTGGTSAGHYESLPGMESNIYEAIEPKNSSAKGANAKKSGKSHNSNKTAAPVGNKSQYPPVPPPLTQPVVRGDQTGRAPVDDFHYLINNDEYAVVRKPGRQPVSSSKSYSVSLSKPVINGGLGDHISESDSHNSPQLEVETEDHSWKRRSAPTARVSSWAYREMPDNAV